MIYSISTTYRHHIMSKTYVYIVTTYTNPPTSSYPPPFTTKKCTLEPYEGSIADANARALSLLYDHYVKNRGHGSRYWEALEQEWKKKKVLVYRSKDGCLEMKDFPKDSYGASLSNSVHKLTINSGTQPNQLFESA